MDKKSALIILIQHSYVLTDSDKVKLLGNIDKLSAEEIDELGTLLASQKKAAIENNDEIIKKLEEVEKKLSSELNKTK